MVPVLRERAGVTIAGVVILVDRDEKGGSDISAVKEAERDLKIAVHPIVNINQIIQYLSEPNSSGFQIDATLKDRIVAYRKEFGA
jgi:orotate phosphoribosyltransferase